MTTLDERVLRIIQRRLGYNDAEMDIFINNSRNMQLLALGKELQNKLIVLEVVESKGCNSNHKVGDKFYFDYAGNLITELCPAKVCSFALNGAIMGVFAAGEMLYAGIDPAEMKFKRSGCFDVGIECGGWGRIVLELKIEERQPV